MAITSANGKYMTLDNVRVFYDKTTDSIILTSKDADIPRDAKGFKINIDSGKEAGYALRRMLGERGIIPNYQDDNLSPDTVDRSEIPDNTPWHTIPLGKSTETDIVMWDTQKFPNLFITGSAGSGKTCTISNIIEHCLKHQDQWEVSVFDMCFPLYYVENFPEITVTRDRIRAVQARLSHYVEELRQREENPFDSHKNILLAVDGLTAIVSSHDTGIKSPDFEANKLLSEQITEHLLTLAERGPAVGVHLVIASQQPYSTKDLSMRNFLSHFKTKMICGDVSPIHVRFLMGEEATPHVRPRRGKSYIKTSESITTFQGINVRG